MQYLLFDIFELLDILDFDIVWVVCEQVDGVWNYILRQEGEQFVCWQTQCKYYGIITFQRCFALHTVVQCDEKEVDCITASL